MNEDQLNERARIFERNWDENPIVSQDNNTLVVKLYNVRRLDSVFQAGERNTRDQITQRSDFFTLAILDRNQIASTEKYISFENFTIKKELKEFSELQDIQNKYLSFIDNIPSGYAITDITYINTQKYDNYLDHLNKVKMIRTKTSKIVRDKFNVTDSSDVDTSAIFANVGYVVKGFEGKYITLSKGDRTFIKNFMDDQIKAGAYQLTLSETLPLYKESIREIIKMARELLTLTGNKTKLKAFSKKVLGEERKSLESCWQFY
jgi:hypothetical protein